MYYMYWKNVDDKCSVTIKASDLMSYFADHDEGGVFYQLPEFSKAVHRIHNVVGNAVTKGRYIIGGTGSSQLFTVTLAALASRINSCNQIKNKRRIPVVCAQPYYSVIILYPYYIVLHGQFIHLNMKLNIYINYIYIYI